MKTVLLEGGEGKQKIYDSLVVEPKHMAVFRSGLEIKVINELAKQPACAMDIAKTLKQHEQKIYYHLRKMKDAGIVRQAGLENRYGMTAKMFELTSPVVAAKLYEKSHVVEGEKKDIDPTIEKFLDPFVKDGRLNAKIIIGDSFSHGQYDAPSTEGPHTFDIGVFLGKYLTEIKFPTYNLDTDINEREMNNNMILFGNSRTNVIIDKINANMPVYFDQKSGAIVDNNSNVKYDDPRIGMIGKFQNPFNKNKKILVIGGVRTRGTQAAVIAFTQYFDVIFKDCDKNPLFKIVKGFDKNGDKIIDSIEVIN